MASSYNKPNFPPVSNDRRPTNKRFAAIEELVHTEERYVRTLAILVAEFLNPIEERELLKRNEIDTMFSGIKVIANLNGNFLRDLETLFENYDDQSSEVGKVCLDFFPYLKMYRTYCANHKKAAIMLTAKLKKASEFSRFVEAKSLKLASSSSSNHNLSALMILPVQRCCRYELLLREILSNTHQAHPDYENLTNAFAMIQDIVTVINEGVSDIEQREIVRTVERKLGIPLLDPARKFLRYGEIWKKSKSNAKRDQLYTFFVFNNLIIYAKKTGDQFAIKRQMEVNDAFSVVDIPDYDNQTMPQNTFQLFTSDKSFYCYTDTEEQKNEWLNVFRAVQQQVEATIGQAGRKNKPAPIWQADSGAVKCSIASCNVKFNLFHRRHHCRVCGFVVCAKCSMQTIPNPHNPLEKQRVCDICIDRMNNRKQAPPVPSRPDHAANTAGMPTFKKGASTPAPSASPTGRAPILPPR